MEASTQLLVNPIMGLMPRYAETDHKKFVSEGMKAVDASNCTSYKNLIISLSNLLYKIDLDEKDKKLLVKSFKKNKEFLSVMKISMEDLDVSIINTVCSCLAFKYSC